MWAWEGLCGTQLDFQDVKRERRGLLRLNGSTWRVQVGSLILAIFCFLEMKGRTRL